MITSAKLRHIIRNYAFARKKEATRRTQEKMWKEVSGRWKKPQLVRTLDSYSLPKGLVLQRVPEVSSGEPEQVRGKTRIKPTRYGLPNSGEEAMALIKEPALPSFVHCCH